MIFLLASACVLTPTWVGGDDSGGATGARPELVVTVTDAGTGQALPEAWVILTPGGRDAVTGADGVARFPNLEPGSYALDVAAAGHLPAEGEAEVTTGATASVALTGLVDGTGMIRGLALLPGAAGGGVAGATVEVDGVAMGTSDASGEWWAYNVPVGRHTVRVVPPAGSSLQPWTSAAVDVSAGQGAVMSTVLPGSSPGGATFVGSDACVACHADAAALHATSGHSRAGRTPTDVESAGPAGLAAAFAEGASVSLEPAVAGASITLARSGPGVWTARVRDGAGASTDAWPVVEVYGGWRSGAALAVEADGVRLLLPAVWAVEGAGLPAGREAEGFVPAWTDAWFDGAGALVLGGDGRPGTGADWDLACAGCHATGATLTAVGDGHYALAATAGTMERTVGCEACHGAGSAHVSAAQAGAESASAIFDPTDVPASARLESCARCHERATSTSSPFEDVPGWPITDSGSTLPPWATLTSYAAPTPTRWAAVPVSRLHRDEVGDLATSPHRGGVDAYQGACEDCHAAHGSAEPAALRVAATDRALCTTCHAAAFPDPSVDATHTAHLQFDPGAWSPGACVGCHLPRGAVAFRPDSLSGAGEVRSHGLLPWSPAATVAEFDAVGATTLPLGESPTSACLDCHLQADAEAAAAGSGCPCPANDPTERQTHVDLAEIYDDLFGGAR